MPPRTRQPRRPITAFRARIPSKNSLQYLPAGIREPTRPAAGAYTSGVWGESSLPHASDFFVSAYETIAGRNTIIGLFAFPSHTPVPRQPDSTSKSRIVAFTAIDNPCNSADSTHGHETRHRAGLGRNGKNRCFAVPSRTTMPRWLNYTPKPHIVAFTRISNRYDSADSTQRQRNPAVTSAAPYTGTDDACAGTGAGATGDPGTKSQGMRWANTAKRNRMTKPS